MMLLMAVLLSACSSVAEKAGSLPKTISSHMIRPYFHFKNQGIYEGCSLTQGAVCLDRLQQIAQAGFTLVMNYDQLESSVQEELAYAQKAATLGIKIIWNMDYPVLRDQGDILHTFPQLAAACKCSTTAPFVKYVIDLVKHLPATWGYYIGDEVSLTERAKLQAFTNDIKALDPSHPRLIVQGANSVLTAKTNLTPFVNTADVLSVDFYPVGTVDESVSETGPIAQFVQSLANQHGKQSAMVLQAYSRSEYADPPCSPFPACTTYPTMDEMRQQLDLVLRNAHPALILWYSYFDILRSDNAPEHWKDLIQAAKG